MKTRASVSSQADPLSNVRRYGNHARLTPSECSLLDALVEHGGVTKAARALGLGEIYIGSHGNGSGEARRGEFERCHSAMDRAEGCGVITRTPDRILLRPASPRRDGEKKHARTRACEKARDISRIHLRNAEREEVSLLFKSRSN